MKVGSCLMVRNEERHIAEWLAWQHIMGVDLTIVYDNDSTDRTAEIVRKIARTQNIELINWPGDPKPGHGRALRDCARRHRDDLDWILFSDADEFFVPLVHADLKSYLRDDRFSDASGIAVNWAIFGSSGHEEIPEGLIIESFTRRASNDLTANQHVKSILRPSAIIGPITSHAAVIDGAYLDADGKPVTWVKLGKTLTPPTLCSAQINHYFTRSKAHWARRMERGFGSAIPRTWEEFHAHDRNEVEDLNAFRFLAELHSRLELYDRPPSHGNTSTDLMGRFQRMRDLLGRVRPFARSA